MDTITRLNRLGVPILTMSEICKDAIRESLKCQPKRTTQEDRERIERFVEALESK